MKEMPENEIGKTLKGKEGRVFWIMGYCRSDK
jgi:hypothetical protein